MTINTILTIPGLWYNYKRWTCWTARKKLSRLRLDLILNMGVQKTSLPQIKWNGRRGFKETKACGPFSPFLPLVTRPSFDGLIFERPKCPEWVLTKNIGYGRKMCGRTTFSSIGLNPNTLCWTIDSRWSQRVVSVDLNDQLPWMGTEGLRKVQGE